MYVMMNRVSEIYRFNYVLLLGYLLTSVPQMNGYY